jgi:uncharacterized lipoprotein
MLRTRLIWLILLAGALLLSGCSYLPELDEVLPDKRTEYEKSESLPDLEIPPDLSSDSITDTMAVPDVDKTGAATFSTYQERNAIRERAEPESIPESVEEVPAEVPEETTRSSEDYLTGQSSGAGAAESTPESKSPSRPLATGADRASLMRAEEGKQYLLVREDFEETWSLLENRLEQAGLKVEDEDASRGIYYVRYAGSSDADKGVLSKLAFWSDDEEREYQLSVTSVAEGTEVVLLDEEGNWEDSEAAVKILTAVAKKLNE